jgi:hypothetical protein
MTTQINVRVTGGGVVGQNKRDAEANRQSLRNREEQAVTISGAQRGIIQVNEQTVSAPPGKARRSEYVKEKPAANRFGGPLLLLRMNGANGSANFLDSGRRRLPVTVNGNAQITTSDSKYGGGSGLFDGNGDWLSISDASLALGTGDFTIEAWVKIPYGSANVGYNALCIFPNPTAIDTGLYVYVYYDQEAKITWYFNSDNIEAYTYLNAGEWNHVAAVQQSGTVYLYTNGIKEPDSFPDHPAITIPQILIGSNDNGEGEFFKGLIDDFRISDKAIYTDNFTPPPAPF